MLQNFSVEYSACSVARHISNVCIQREIKNSEDKKVWTQAENSFETATVF